MATRLENVDRLAEHVAKAVAKAPPLTPEQRDRIALLLSPAPAVRGEAA